jgi:hypothetical protein
MKKIAISLLLIVTLLMSALLVSCVDDGKEYDDYEDFQTNSTEKETDEQGSEVGTAASTEIGNPGEYSYTECDQTVFVNNPGSAVTLRTAEYVSKGSVAHGTELRRIGLSTDEANYWSKVIYEEKEYYVATKYLTTLSNPDEGFVDVDKTVVVNEKTGSLNIRNLPSMESTIIGHAVAGKDIKVIAENTTSGWYKVEFKNNEGNTATGYIASDAKYFETATTETTTEAAQ